MKDWKSPMDKDYLQFWIARRKKASPMKDKKKYTRKRKHKKKFENE